MQEQDTERVYSVQRDAPVSEPPHRVVSLVPCITESLFELQLGDRVIAITDDCRFPEQALTAVERIGPQSAPDIQRIIALRPDLVIASRDENRPDDIDALTQRGIPMWVIGPRTVRESFNLLWSIMDVFEMPAMVEAVRAMEWQCDWLERLDESRSKPCRVFVLTGLYPLTTIGGDSFASDLLRVCGGYNVFADRLQHRRPGLPVYPQVTPEDVKNARPDIVLIPTAAPDPTLVEAARQFCTESHIRFVDAFLLFWYGTRVSRAFKTLPDKLCALDSAYNLDKDEE